MRYLIILLGLFFCMEIYSQDNKSIEKGKFPPKEKQLKLSGPSLSPVIEITDGKRMNFTDSNGSVISKENTVNPTNFNYVPDSIKNFDLKKRLFYLYSSEDEWPELTTVIRKSAFFNYRSSYLHLLLGEDVVKYGYINRPYYDFVIHSSVLFSPLKCLFVGGYMNHSFFSKENFSQGSILPSPMIPYSSYGINVGIRLNDKFWIEGSIGKEYNPMRGKWVNTYSLSPFKW